MENQPQLPEEKIERLSHGFKRTLFGLSPTFVNTSKEDKYGYLFRNRTRIPYTPANRDLLENLGKNMLEDATVFEQSDSTIDSGYTYFGQFVDHDIALDVDSTLDNEQDARDLVNYRTPNLELDSVYGDGPAIDAFLYDKEGVKLLLGTNSLSRAGNQVVDFDLPRTSTGTAIIGDPRNDENLFVAQMHMSFIRFHNAVVDALKATRPDLTKPEDLFKEAQKEVRRHYQWVLINDYLRVIVGNAAIDDVLNNGPKLFPARRRFFMPVEFSVAAYRFGHSLIRDTYRFNQFFPNDSFFYAFLFTKRIVPGDWVINWRSFFTVDGVNAANKARKIDTRIAFSMSQLPGPAAQGSFFATLSSRNLVRSMALKVATGQSVAKQLKITPLTKEQLLTNPFSNPTSAQLQMHQQTIEILTSENELLLKKTPLWYYILKEAEVLNQGNQLGPVGGTIVAEIFVRLLNQTESSFLSDLTWKPKFGLQGNEPRNYNIVDLLRFAGTLIIPGID